MHRYFFTLILGLILIRFDVIYPESPRLLNGVSIPSDFPVFENYILGAGVAPGRIFINSHGSTPYIMILENDGSPYFYRRLKVKTWDFKPQPAGILTHLIRPDLPAFVTMDSSYSILDTLQCVGYRTDVHELLMLDNGSYFMIGLDTRKVDMSQVVQGGDPEATVIDNHIQGFDANHNLIFEWLCYDHFNIRDAAHENLQADRIDYVHMNSIALDFDGHIVISSRNLSEVTKIHRQTGEVIWRLGGKNNQFTFINDPYGISYQHDARPVPGKPNHYTLFDNGNFHKPIFSRAVEFKLDTVAMTATRVWQYSHTQDRYTAWMGSVQRLKNGNTLINWANANLPKVTEVTPDGKIVCEGNFSDNILCYRTSRFEWSGVASEPYLIAEAFPEKVSLIFNKFGDNTVNGYIVYAARENNAFLPIDTTANPYLELTNLENRSNYRFRVSSFDDAGQESPLSNTEEVYVNYVSPGENSILNGTFEEGINHWNFYTHNDAAASATITEYGEVKLEIENGGGDFASVQLLQNEIPLIKGRKYSFRFDAYADEERVLDAKLETDGSPSINYGKIGPTELQKRIRNYSYTFTMEDPTDYKARVVFNCGKSAANVHIDNVSVTEVASGIEEPATLPVIGFQLLPNYPNPFNSSTTIHYQVGNVSEYGQTSIAPDRVETHDNASGTPVRLTIHNILGQKIATLVSGKQLPGKYQTLWNGMDDNGKTMSSGLYFCRLEVGTLMQTRKLVLVK